jgi:hypothetical protein
MPAGNLAPHNRPDPYAYLRDVLDRHPTQPNSRIDDLLPQRWTWRSDTHQELGKVTCPAAYCAR